MVLFADTVKLFKVEAPECRLSAPVFVIVALPVVVSVAIGVVVLIFPMSPDPDVRATEVVPETLPLD
jgi:hypothetical protein